MNSGATFIYSIGLVFATLIFYDIIILADKWEEYKAHKQLIKECEQHLPRNVYCELKAVVAFPEINEEKR